MWWKWNAWNTEPTVPSTGKNKFIKDMVRVGLTDMAYHFQIYDTPLGHRWLAALKDNLKQQRILEIQKLSLAIVYTTLMKKVSMDFPQ